MNIASENGKKKKNFWARFWPIWAPNFVVGFTSRKLEIAPSYHPMQSPGKLTNQASGNGKKT